MQQLGSGVAIDSFLKYLDSFPSLQQFDIRLHVVMSPAKSGASILFESPVTNRIDMTLVYSFEDESQLPPGYWWPKLIMLSLHEMYHVNFELDRDAYSHSRENEEAAASLLEACVGSDIATETESRFAYRINVLTEAGLRQFPGLTEGRFSPSASALDELAHASLRGDSIASAILFLELGMEEYVLFRDSTALNQLKQACLDFGTRVPDFMSGERPWLDNA